MAAVAAAADTATISSSAVATSTSSTSAAATYTIAVGATGFTFEPHQVSNASIGDIIEWRFYPTGHSVVRDEFKQSCIPYEDTGPNKVGFSGGFENVATTSDNGPRFRVRVNDTNPILFYCAAPGSCTNHHMVGVINPNATETYDIQLAYAQNASYQMAPGDPFPSETVAASTATPTSSLSSGPSSSPDSSSHLGVGAIAGIAIGSAAVAIMAAALLYMCGRRGGYDRALHHGRGPGHAYDSGHARPVARFADGRPISPGPKSPGQETFATAYSAAPSSDTYQMQTRAYGGAGGYPAMLAGYRPPSSTSPPPASDYSQSFNNAHGQHTGGPVLGSSPPPGGLEGTNATANGFFIRPRSPSQPFTYPSSTPGHAVELPTSNDPGSSPLPRYQEQKTYNWVQDGPYRPRKPQ